MHNTAVGPAIFDSRLPAEVVGNGGSTYFKVGAFDSNAELVVAPITDGWNNTLKTLPNGLTKSVFTHISAYNYSSTANIRVYTANTRQDLAGVCGRPVLGCIGGALSLGDPASDLSQRPLYLYLAISDDQGFPVDMSATGQHELGHAMFHNEHYVPAQTQGGLPSCDTFVSIMNAYGCLGVEDVTPHDEDDFFNGYKPRRQPGPVTMSIPNGSQATFTFNSGQPLQHNVARYDVQMLSDRNGTVLADTFVNGLPEFGAVFNAVTYNLSAGTRICTRAAGISDASFQALNALTPFSPHGCISRSASPYSTSFIATSHPNSTGTSIVITVRNGQSSTRYMQVTGPGLENLGSCSNVSYRSIGASGGTRTCSVAESDADNFNRLAVFIWSSSSGGTLIAAITLDTDAG